MESCFRAQSGRLSPPRRARLFAASLAMFVRQEEDDGDGEVEEGGREGRLLERGGRGGWQPIVLINQGHAE